MRVLAFSIKKRTCAPNSGLCSIMITTVASVVVLIFIIEAVVIVVLITAVVATMVIGQAEMPRQLKEGTAPAAAPEARRVFGTSGWQVPMVGAAVKSRYGMIIEVKVRSKEGWGAFGVAVSVRLQQPAS